MSKSQTITLVVADNQPVIRSGLQTVFADSPFHIVAEATTGKKALSLVRKHKPDVLLLDVLFPDMDGFSVLDTVQKAKLATRVVMLSAFDNPTYVARAMAGGAWDFVFKTAPVSELRRAVERAYRREVPDEASAVHQIKRAMNQRVAEPDTGLTAREAQVLRHVSLGLSNKEIGWSLGISIETVKEHVQNILRKTENTDRTQAAVWAVKSGLLE